MPRRARTYLPGLPCHVTQRGNNRQPCFFDSTDRDLYLELLAGCARRYDVAVHAFVLMTNHVHLLLTPQAEDGISRLMRVTGSRYAQWMNRKYARTGTLWEGRHKASVIATDSYLLCCYRYIEMNPVRAGITASPAAYRWSSHRANACGETIEWLHAHPLYEALGATATARQAAYRSLFDQQETIRIDAAIRSAMLSCLPLGDFGTRPDRTQGAARTPHLAGGRRITPAAPPP